MIEVLFDATSVLWFPPIDVWLALNVVRLALELLLVLWLPASGASSTKRSGTSPEPVEHAYSQVLESELNALPSGHDVTQCVPSVDQAAVLLAGKNSPGAQTGAQARLLSSATVPDGHCEELHAPVPFACTWR